MAWTVIPDSDIDPDSPVTTGLMTALRDNVAAFAAGDSGRPDLKEEALTPITAGSSYRYSVDTAEITISDTAYTDTGLRIIIPRTGTYQISIDLKVITVGTQYSKVYRNASTGYTREVALGVEQSTTSTSYVTKTESLSLNAGDILYLYAKRLTADSNIRNFRIESAIKLFG